MNLKELLKKGGATLTKELKAIDKTSGYMVSKIDCEKTYSFNQLEELEEEILNYKTKLQKNEYIGLWIDNNIIYLDISKHYMARDKAIKAGLKNRQLAIYDLKENKSIYLTKKAYIIYKYNRINNDLIYYKEYYNINDIMEEFNLNNKKSIYHFIIDNVDNNFNKLLNDNYIIVSEEIPLFEEL